MTLEAEHNPSRQRILAAHLSNYVQAGILLTAFSALLAAVLWPRFGEASVVVALLAAVGIFALAARLPPDTAMRIYGARPYEAGDLAQFDQIATELALRAGVERTPRLYLVPSMMVTAFSLGSTQNFAIALTEGLLRRLTMREVTAILAREIAHAERGDLLIFGIADLISRCAQGFYYVGLTLVALNLFGAMTGGDQAPWLVVLLLVLSPALLNLLQIALSRAREREVDRSAALLTGDPLGVASAISRLDVDPGAPLEDIIPPVPARKVGLPSMLRLANDIERRVALVSGFRVPPMPPLNVTEGPRISLIGVGPIELRPRYRWPGIWL
jgi:heat shock protein HtpX